MKLMIDSTTLLKDAELLRKRFDQQGYLFFKKLLNAEELNRLAIDVTNVLVDHGWLKSNVEKDPMLRPHVMPAVEGEEAYLRVYDDVQRLERFHKLPHTKPLISLMESLHRGAVFPHPLSIARLVFPHNTQWSTPAHQDYPNNQGTKNLFASWIPLTDCPIQKGALSVLPGSHTQGVFPLEFSLGAGHRKAIIDKKLEPLEWVASDFELGDVLVFHSLCLHKSLDNMTSGFRLSVDYRFQKEGDSLTLGCLQPHFQRLEWEDIYKGWNDQSLKRYWNSKEYNVVDWDESYHQLSEVEEEESMKTRLKYDRQKVKDFENRNGH